MGITGLTKILSEKAPDAFITVPVSKFAGKRIAIDGNNWMFSNMSTARKKVINSTANIDTEDPDPFIIRQEWLALFINFVSRMMSFNITPIFVFDGKHPVQKKQKQDKTKDSRIKLKGEIDKLREQLKNPNVEQRGKLFEILRKKLSNYIVISPEDHTTFRNFAKGIIPCYVSTGEGERLASTLCYEGKAAACFSADVDNLAFRCPLLITEYSKDKNYDEYGSVTPHFKCIRLDKVLVGLNMSHAMFVDLCIMSGCDYNTNMRGYAVKKSYNLLQEHHSIDNLPKTLDTRCLDHLTCRELFKYIPSSELTQREEYIHDMDINKLSEEEIKAHLDSVGMSDSFDRLHGLYTLMVASSDGSVDELELVVVPHYTIPPPTLRLRIVRD